MPSFAELNTTVDELIRKGLEVGVWFAPLSVTDEIDKLKDGTGLVIPAGYAPVGRITKDQGASWSRDVSTSDVMSLGASQPTRTDITSDVTGLSFTMQESKRLAMEIHDGVDLSSVTFDADGNLFYDKPDRPRQDYFRVLVLGKDGDGLDATYFGKWLPRARVTDRGEQAYNEENELQYPVTLNAFKDADFGTAVRTLWAGSADRLTDMGFTASV